MVLLKAVGIALTLEQNTCKKRIDFCSKKKKKGLIFAAISHRFLPASLPSCVLMCM